MRIHLPSPAAVISVVALVVAMAGTSYAVTALPKNSVGTKQLKKHAVTTPKLADSAAARIAGLGYGKFSPSIPPGALAKITVACPAGLAAIGGGSESPPSSDPLFIVDTHPTIGGWVVSVANPATVKQTVNAYAVCAKGAASAAKTSSARRPASRIQIVH